MREDKKLIYAIVIAVIVLASIIYVFLYNSIDENSEDIGEVTETTPSQAVEASTEPMMVYVYVCGAVKNKGVYHVKEDSRVFEVLDMAGGLSSEAADNIINPVRKVKDGEMIYFPTKEEVESGTYLSEINTLININNASKEKLMELPGIGETKALSIIRYRDDNNGFDTIEEIMNVEGIKEGMFESIKTLITI